MARPESLYHNYYSSYVEPADTMLRPNNLRSKSSYNINQPAPAANKFGSRSVVILKGAIHLILLG